MNLIAQFFRLIGVTMTFTNNSTFAVSVVVDGNEMTVLPGQTVSGTTVVFLDAQRAGGSGEE